MNDKQARAEHTTSEINGILRALPSVDWLISSKEGAQLVEEFGRPLALDAFRQSLEEIRRQILANGDVSATNDAVLERAKHLLQDMAQSSMRPVINATGVIVHTNLGRAIMSQGSVEAVARIASSYSNLEYELADGARGSRSVHVESLLQQLSGAEAAHAVNNNAAAILLMLSALCNGKEVIIGRGQLIEIGGGFRVPDVMAQSGAQLLEVGTTNRTHLRDYSEAISENTAAILVAHRSNFRIMGFTSEPELGELATLAHDHNILLLYDQGSGAVRDTAAYGLEREVTVQEALQTGVDVIAFSGDKLLGGPQVGILCGNYSLIQAIKRHPLARAVRADKMCLAALSNTLRSHLLGKAEEEIPVWRMISSTVNQLKQRAESWQERLVGAGIASGLRQGQSTVGGGSLPGSVLPTWLIAVEVEKPDVVSALLRNAATPVICRIADNQLLFDPRTVLVEQEDALVETIIEVTQAIRMNQGSEVLNGGE